MRRLVVAGALAIASLATTVVAQDPANDETMALKDTRALLGGIELGDDIGAVEGHLLKHDPAAMALQARLREETPLDASGTKTVALGGAVRVSLEFAGHEPTSVVLKCLGSRVMAVAFVFRVGQEALRVFEDARSRLTQLKGPPTASDWATTAWNDGTNLTAVIHDFLTHTVTVAVFRTELLATDASSRELDELVGISLPATAVARAAGVSTLEDGMVVLGAVELCGDVAATEARVAHDDPTAKQRLAGMREQTAADATGTKYVELQGALPISVEFGGYAPTSVVMTSRGSRVAAVALIFQLGQDTSSLFQDATSKLAQFKGPPTAADWTAVVWEEGAKRTSVVRDYMSDRATVVMWLCNDLVPGAKTPAELAEMFLAQTRGEATAAPELAAAARGPRREAGANALQRLRAKCAADWPDDYVMQKFCVDTQTKALEALALGTAPSTMPSEVWEGIRAKCAGDWPEDYVMQKFCVGQQEESWHALHPRL